MPRTFTRNNKAPACSTSSGAASLDFKTVRRTNRKSFVTRALVSFGGLCSKEVMTFLDRRSFSAADSLTTEASAALPLVLILMLIFVFLIGVYVCKPSFLFDWSRRVQAVRSSVVLHEPN